MSFISFSKSASGKTIPGFLPPSSSESFFLGWSAEDFLMRAPVTVPPLMFIQEFC